MVPSTVLGSRVAGFDFSHHSSHPLSAPSACAQSQLMPAVESTQVTRRVSCSSTTHSRIDVLDQRLHAVLVRGSGSEVPSPRAPQPASAAVVRMAARMLAMVSVVCLAVRFIRGFPGRR